MTKTFELPNMVWMEVDTRNKEPPLKIADSAAELARMCGATENNVKSSAAHAKYGREKRRFVKVWIGEGV